MKYKTPADLEQAVSEYFAECRAEKRPYTMCGLALALGLTREGLAGYSRRDEYSDIILQARQHVEAYAEERLHSGGSPVGVIFSLKNNFGWKDKSEIEVNDVSKASEEDLMRKLEQLISKARIDNAKPVEIIQHVPRQLVR